MDDRENLLMKAKALAALANGILPSTLNGTTFYATILTSPPGELPMQWKLVCPEHGSPIEALAAAADALGLEPNPAVVVLTEEEKAILNDALLEYRNIALDHAVNQQRRGYEESAESWRRTAEQAESLRQRLVGE